MSKKFYIKLTNSDLDFLDCPSMDMFVSLAERMLKAKVEVVPPFSEKEKLVNLWYTSKVTRKKLTFSLCRYKDNSSKEIIETVLTCQ